ncbi:checkpoint protein Hus1/Mec3 [Catenaria anguillulae PL171]|uniref:Checkpoint protein n=1 Tax=Catenaria anguillulae PL171 TaxID=765915 RepID=A0A1Y2H931_9FUNG|nr:checkpoint protein Hus1/Mec3 [Catenaria anguillulae PL171]
MRLKARITNPRPLHNLTSSLSPLSKSLVLKFTPTQLALILKDASESSTQVWCTLPAASVLDDYVVESTLRNEIYLQCHLPTLARAVKSMLHAHNATIKLTRSPTLGALLAILVESETTSGRPLNISHNVPVIPLKRTQAAELREPRVGVPAVYITMPKPLTMVKVVAERMKALGAVVSVKANGPRGEVKVSVLGAHAEVETTWGGLKEVRNVAVETTAGASTRQAGEGADEWVEVSVGARDFVKFLNCHVANPAHVICALIPGMCAVFYVYMYSTTTHNPFATNSTTSSTVDEAAAGTRNDTLLTYYLPMRHSI